MPGSSVGLPRRKTTASATMVQPGGTSGTTPETADKLIAKPIESTPSKQHRKGQRQDAHRDPSEHNKSSSPVPSPGSSGGRRGRSRTRGTTAGAHNHLDQMAANVDRQYVVYTMSRIDLNSSRMRWHAQGVPFLDVILRKGVSCRETVEAASRDGERGIRIRYVSAALFAYVRVLCLSRTSQLRRRRDLRGTRRY